MGNKKFEITLEQFEISLGAYVHNLVDQVIKKGYNEDEIVAMDLEEDHALFYMSDGEIIKIKKPTIMHVMKTVEA
jgi:hypothetical protein